MVIRWRDVDMARLVPCVVSGATNWQRSPTLHDLRQAAGSVASQVLHDQYCGREISGQVRQHGAERFGRACRATNNDNRRGEHGRSIAGGVAKGAESTAWILAKTQAVKGRLTGERMRG